MASSVQSTDTELISSIYKECFPYDREDPLPGVTVPSDIPFHLHGYFSILAT